jgi:hypothetical protein
MNPDNGVIIEKSASDRRIAEGTSGLENDFDEQKEILQLLTEEATQIGSTDINGKVAFCTQLLSWRRPWLT